MSAHSTLSVLNLVKLRPEREVEAEQVVSSDPKTNVNHTSTRVYNTYESRTNIFILLSLINPFYFVT